MTVRALLVAPSDNSTREPELRAHCPSIGKLTVAPVPRPARTLFTDAIPINRACTPQPIDAFAGKPFHLIIYGCRTAELLAGPAGDSQIAQTLSQRFGVETVTTAESTVEVPRHEHAARIDVGTPYLDVINKGLADFLTAGGIEVNVLNSFSCKTTVELRTIQSDQVFALAHETAPSEGQALSIAYSQLPAPDIIMPLRRELHRPVWSSI